MKDRVLQIPGSTNTPLMFLQNEGNFLEELQNFAAEPFQDLPEIPHFLEQFHEEKLSIEMEKRLVELSREKKFIFREPEQKSKRKVKKAEDLIDKAQELLE